MNFKERARALSRDIPAVFLAMKHRDTPLSAKLLAALAVGYALSPIDLIPDFVPVLGYLDDVLLLPLLIALALRRIPPEVMEECRRESEGLWAGGKPKRWFLALPVLAVWCALLVLLIWYLCK